MKKIILFILFFSLLISNVYGQIPILNPESTELKAGALTIVHTLYEYYQTNSYTIFNFDVLNSSFGKLDNIQANCSFYFFNHAGSLLVNDSLQYNSTIKLWYYSISSDNITTQDDYSYYVYCIANQNERGFVKQAFEITPTGTQPKDNTLLGFIIYIPLIIAIFLFISGWMLGNILNFEGKPKYPVLKEAMILLSLVSVWVSYKYASMSISRFYNFSTLVDSIGEDTFIFTIIWLILVFIIINQLIKDLYEYIGKKRNKTGEY